MEVLPAAAQPLAAGVLDGGLEERPRPPAGGEEQGVGSPPERFQPRVPLRLGEALEASRRSPRASCGRSRPSRAARSRRETAGRIEDKRLLARPIGARPRSGTRRDRQGVRAAPVDRARDPHPLDLIS